MPERRGNRGLWVRQAMAVGLLMLAWVPACFSGLEDLAPFPCAENGECPAGFSCGADGACVQTPDCYGSVCDATCVDTTTDETNCGACGNVCSGEFSCCGSRCRDLSISDESCGACGVACVGGAFCEASACRCPDEVPLFCTETCIDPTSNPLHCGACDVVCAETEECREGGCECLPENTCGPNDECVDLLENPEHCGKCDNACPSGDCIKGVCSAIVLAPDQRGAGSITMSSDTLFWTNWGTPAQQYQDGSVMRMSTTGGSPSQLATGLHGVRLGLTGVGSGIVHDVDNVYFVENGAAPDYSGTVQSVSATGGGQSILASGVTFPTALAGGGSDLWFNYASVPGTSQLNEIGRIALPGGGFNPVVQGDLDIIRIQRSIDNRLFFGSFGGLDDDGKIVRDGSIWASQLDGSMPEQILGFPGRILLDLAVGQNRMAYIVLGADDIQVKTAALDGTDAQVLSTKASSLPFRLYVDSGSVFWLEFVAPDEPTCSSSDPMCTESVSNTSCKCTPCADDGVCAPEEDCTCPDCFGGVRCYGVGICDDNDICSPYSEGCDCADCENHSRCSHDRWSVYEASIDGSAGSTLVAAGTGNVSDFVQDTQAVFVTSQGTYGRGYSDGAILKGEKP